MQTHANWIWHTAQASTETELVLFCRDVELTDIPASCPIVLAADTRYRLFVNGTYVQRGPLRASASYWYRDTVDIAPYLQRGTNRVAVEVLHYSADPLLAQRHEGGPAALVASVHGGLMLEEQQTTYGFGTYKGWYCRPISAYTLSGFRSAGYANAFEHIDGRDYPHGWEQPGAALDDFLPATALCTARNEIDVYGVQNVWRLKDRPVPMPYETAESFVGYTNCDPVHRHLWERFLSGDAVEIPAFTTTYIELNTDDYVTGYPVLQVQDGWGTAVTVTYSEGYGRAATAGAYTKDARDNHRVELGQTLAYPESDSYCCGSGEQRYSPLYCRAFRFVRLELKTGETPLLLKRFSYVKTGYPLDVQAEITGNAELEQLWDVSLRTMRNCMLETYVDCPFFEQMQYVMDTMLQAQYTYPLSADTRLTRKAMRDFYEAQLPDGLIPCYAPSKYLQIIPCFGLYWILMVTEYYSRFGDLAEIREYLPGIERLIGFFERHVGNDGLYHHPYGWDFVDWVPTWRLGCPVSEDGQVNLLDNLLLLYVLKQSETLMKAAGRRDMATEYGDFYDNLSAAIMQAGYDEQDGLFRSATASSRKSQHAQALAVLSGLVEGEEARALLQRMLEADEIDRISFPMLYFLFRALESADLYEETESLTEAWKECVNLALKTMPESADLNGARSDCHAWSALPLYEYTTCYLGVRPSDFGEAIIIKPQAVWISNCEGSVVTPKGTVKVHVWQVNGNFYVEATAPSVPVYVELPGGTKQEFPLGGRISLSEPIGVKRKRGIA